MCAVKIKYGSVVPWGRTFEEYVDMFNLTEADLDKFILGCADGPASFNYTMKEKGKEMISIDPIYHFTKDDILKRISENYQDVINQTKQNKDKFIWTKIKDVEDLGRIRMLAMEKFLADYDLGKQENRYLYAMLPNLPFEDNQFDLALSSHFLFLYSDNLSLEFHIEAIDEMLRVAREVRIFPLLDLNGRKSLYVDKVINNYIEKGYSVDEVTVDYQFQKGGNTMLKIAQKR
jgi:hypothetical protein